MSASPDQLLVTPLEEQKASSVVFDVPTSEMKKNYKFCSVNEKSGNILQCFYFLLFIFINYDLLVLN